MIFCLIYKYIIIYSWEYLLIEKGVTNMNLKQIDNDAELLKMLGDKTRLTIYALLNSKELCVCAMTSLLNISQPAISQHLKKMKLFNIINERKEGQWVFYSIRKPNEDEYMLKAIIENLPDLTDLIKTVDIEKKKCIVKQMHF